jgi:1-deoxy-D-xylulose-5-phosphate synthase
MKTLRIGKAELERPGRDVVLIGFGATVRPCIEAAEVLMQHGIDAAVVNLRFVKPLDKELLLEVIGETRWAVTVEENVRPGGIGDAVLELLADHRMADRLLDSLTMPDEFVDHGPQKVFRAQYGLDGPGIAQRVRELLEGVGAVRASSEATGVIGGGGAA